MRVFRAPNLFTTTASSVVGIEQRSLFKKFPLLSNLTICVAFGGLGDLIEQMLENLRRNKKIGYANWDTIRTSKFAAAGIPVGFISHYW